MQSTKTKKYSDVPDAIKVFLWDAAAVGDSYSAIQALKSTRDYLCEHSIITNTPQAHDVVVCDTSKAKTSRGSMTKPELALYCYIADFFGCEVYVCRNWPVIVGQGIAPATAELYADWLLSYLRKARAQARSSVRNAQTGQQVRLTSQEARDMNQQFSTTWVYRLTSQTTFLAFGVTAETSELYRHAVSTSGAIPSSLVSGLELLKG